MQARRRGMQSLEAVAYVHQEGTGLCPWPRILRILKVPDFRPAPGLHVSLMPLASDADEATKPGQTSWITGSRHAKVIASPSGAGTTSAIAEGAKA